MHEPIEISTGVQTEQEKSAALLEKMKGALGKLQPEHLLELQQAIQNNLILREPVKQVEPEISNELRSFIDGPLKDQIEVLYGTNKYKSDDGRLIIDMSYNDLYRDKIIALKALTPAQLAELFTPLFVNALQHRSGFENFTAGTTEGHAAMLLKALVRDAITEIEEF